jgi:hypothetical protein
MDDCFFLFSEYRDEGYEARHYICGDYHLWTWSADDGEIDRFEFHFKDRAIKYSGGGFSRGSENYVMPMFFILEQLFACDADIQAKLLGIRDGYCAESRGAGSADSADGLRTAI